MKYVLTASGERYLARVNAQMIRMHLVRVEVGSGVSAAPEKLEALLDVKQRLQIESVEQDVNEAKQSWTVLRQGQTTIRIPTRPEISISRRAVHRDRCWDGLQTGRQSG